ncbi:hypothetical protein N7454_004702 [Penicillium verhagenii]|nr:hypothetical protein N7454_004702 [Penicillium verhagenii]
MRPARRGPPPKALNAPQRFASHSKVQSAECKMFNVHLNTQITAAEHPDSRPQGSKKTSFMPYGLESSGLSLGVLSNILHWLWLANPLWRKAAVHPRHKDIVSAPAQCREASQDTEKFAFRKCKRDSPRISPQTRILEQRNLPTGLLEQAA